MALRKQVLSNRAQGQRIRHSDIKECGHSRWTRCGNCGCDDCMTLPRKSRHVSRTTIWAHGGIYDTGESDQEDMQDNPFEFREDAVNDADIQDNFIPIYPVDVEHIMRNYARKICLDVYRGQTMRETERDLSRTHYLGPLMGHEAVACLPRTYKQAVALAELPKSTYLSFDVCQNNRCGMVFNTPASQGRNRRLDRCAGCDTPRFEGSLADHSMLVLDFQRELDDFFSDARRVQMLDYCLSPLQGDVWTATRLRDTPDEERKNTLFLTICCDATEFQNQSWTPIVLKINNLHPEARVNKDAMFTLASTYSNICIHRILCINHIVYM